MASNRSPVVRLPPGARRLSFERRVRLWLWAFALAAAVPVGVLAYETSSALSVVLIAYASVAIVWVLAASIFFDQLVRPLQTLANIIASLREDDFSFRARGSRRGDAMGDLALEINLLAAAMQKQRSEALDALTLADRVMLSMPSPVLAFDKEGRLRLLNAAAERVFAVERATAIGRAAAALNLSALLESADEALYTGPAEAAGRSEVRGESPVRWSVRRTAFRLYGVPHTLLMLTDVAAVLREEERSAWQRLIRVLGHEINNSLTPIKSIAGSLQSRLTGGAGDFQGGAATLEDFRRGLSVIEDRAASLNRFLQAYQRLSRLPPPRLEATPLRPILERVMQLETRVPIRLDAGPEIFAMADGDQIQQLLINLIQNAADAALSTGEAPELEIACFASGTQAIVVVRDNGPGLTNPANLFVPFYTTKPNGTGVGLVLAQQIAVAHKGSVHLGNRSDGSRAAGSGCEAELRLPLIMARQRLG